MPVNPKLMVRHRYIMDATIDIHFFNLREFWRSNECKTYLEKITLNAIATYDGKRIRGKRDQYQRICWNT